MPISDRIILCWQTMSLEYRREARLRLMIPLAFGMVVGGLGELSGGEGPALKMASQPIPDSFVIPVLVPQRGVRADPWGRVV